MSDAQLGKLIISTAQRDAIHIAIVPVTAAHQLYAGDHIGLDSEGKASADAEANIGIVDPFLKKTVGPGDWFYMVLYPNTVTGMRHHWKHPAFPDSAAVPMPDISASESWLRKFIADSDCPSYDIVIAAATGQPLPNPDTDYYDVAYRNDGEYLHFNGDDAHGDIPPEFWDHVEVVTGVRIDDSKRATAWSCSC